MGHFRSKDSSASTLMDSGEPKLADTMTNGSKLETV